MRYEHWSAHGLFFYSKDMALKDVRVARAVAPAGLGIVDLFKGTGMKHNLSGARLCGASTSFDMDDNSRPLIALPWVRAPCAGQHDSYTHNLDMAKGRLQPRKYPNSMPTHIMHEFSPIREDVSHSSYDSCDEKTDS